MLSVDFLIVLMEHERTHLWISTVFLPFAMDFIDCTDKLIGNPCEFVESVAGFEQFFIHYSDF